MSLNERGLTIMEVIVSLGMFAILVVGVLGAFAVLARTVKLSREKTILSTLASNYMEIAKNIPYSQIGTIVGNPSGPLADFTNAISVSMESNRYKIYYEVTYIDDPADGTAQAGTDAAPNDYKQVKMSIQNQASGQVTSFVTGIVPQGLEISTGGALKIKVFDAVGQPVAGAGVHIENLLRVPNIILDRVTDASGEVLELNLPVWVNGYHILASKNGYSQDQTYPLSAQNPNPINPDVTVVAGQITSVSLSIDLPANLSIKILNDTCQNLSGVNVNVAGAKLIGTNPDVQKFSQNYSSSGGLIPLNNIEWDTYTPTLLTGQSWVVRGTSPVQKIDVLPGSSQVFTIILDANSAQNSLLVIVKDAGTGIPLESAAVQLQKGGSQPQNYNGITGGSVWSQIDWTGGPGQSDWLGGNPDRYFQDDGNVNIGSVPTGVRLKKTSGNYALSGWLESSAFDTGTDVSNYTILNWQPQSQDPAAALSFQLAANNDNATWQFIGPDGTVGSYYTVPGSGIASVLDNKRYIRYKAFFATTNNKKTPVLTSVNINYVSGCATPGQVFFPNLNAGNNYDLDVSLTGYQSQTIPGLNINGNQAQEVLLGP